MKKNQNICVFCGSSSGVLPIYTQAAEELAQWISDHQMRLIYGADNKGLMGALANKAVELNVHTTGIIPKFLDDIAEHPELDELIITDNMYDRKEIMINKADILVSLPGGFGTLDEIMEVLTLNQLSYIKKPLFLLNINGFWSPLMELYKHIIKSGFASDKHLEQLFIVDNIQQISDHV